MSGSGALGRGSFHSVVAGVQRSSSRPTYYHCSYELLQLHKAHLDVLHHFAVRDKVFDNKFPGCAMANGLFKFIPTRRERYHMRELMEAVRRRSIWMTRIANQRAINERILRRAAHAAGGGSGAGETELAKRFSFRTPDADAYFQPASFHAANTWPNFWQHPTQRHVIPQPRWRRVPELGNITRVEEDGRCLGAVDY